MPVCCREGISRVLLFAALVLSLISPNAFCQTDTPLQPRAVAPEADRKLPEFEVASVKPNTKGGFPGVQTFPGGRVRCEYCRLEWLVMFAFNVQSYQVAGGPGWIHEDAYSIDAEPPASSESARLNPPSPYSPPSEEQRLMLQALLIDRFQLKFHRENKIGQVYVLTQGGGALKLQPPKDANARRWVGSIAGGFINGDGILGQNVSMPSLAVRLSRYFECPILDETGLKGSFDFKYQIVDYDPNLDKQDLVGSILTSLKGIGLNLKSAKGPVETVVIDHVERPSAN